MLILCVHRLPLSCLHAACPHLKVQPWRWCRRYKGICANWYIWNATPLVWVMFVCCLFCYAICARAAVKINARSARAAELTIWRFGRAQETHAAAKPSLSFSLNAFDTSLRALMPLLCAVNQNKRLDFSPAYLWLSFIFIRRDGVEINFLCHSLQVSFNKSVEKVNLRRSLTRLISGALIIALSHGFNAVNKLNA